MFPTISASEVLRNSRTSKPRKKKTGAKSGGSSLEVALLDQIRMAGLPIPEREFRFCSTRKWRADFAFLEPSLPHRVLVEVEGGVWSGKSRHTRGQGFEDDAEKYFEASLLGYVILRVTGKMIEDGRALQMIRRALEKTND